MEVEDGLARLHAVVHHKPADKQRIGVTIHTHVYYIEIYSHLFGGDMGLREGKCEKECTNVDAIHLKTIVLYCGGGGVWALEIQCKKECTNVSPHRDLTG